MSALPIVYYHPASPPSRTVLLVAKALGLEVDAKVVDLLTGENKSDDFAKKNPQRKVPTLEDNGKFLADSHAIATYLVGKYGHSADHPLYPQDLYTRARIDQRLHFESGIVFNSLSAIVQAVFAGAFEYTDKQAEAVHLAYETLETFLAVDPYLVGYNLTVADLSIAPTITQLATQFELSASKYPKVSAWIQRLETLPYFSEINSVNVAAFVTLFDGILANNKLAAQKQ